MSEEIEKEKEEEAEKANEEVKAAALKQEENAAPRVSSCSAGLLLLMWVM